ncbi:allantoinase [Friedmanniella endophytica]|uniref:allantoinase n=1 Tax=Microlunatus kandeliicorticis TaxID=1759536 RepID=A0A7W3IU09_9ACTN|nr:allantoinase AllB [Microlunatus kandeliicorticis]MBA8795227.1 allantoinase [Microlunatus kandeliicorticis]
MTTPGSPAADGGLAAVNRPDRVEQQIREHLAAHPDAERIRAERRAPGQPSWRMSAPPSYDLVVRAGRAVVDGTATAVELGVIDGRIAAVEPLGAGLVGDRMITLTEDEVLIPGVVDTHVHINEPGRTDWEGFATATRAAAAGGVTTVIDMPLNSVPSTVTEPALRYKQLVAAPQLFVDTGFWGGAVPGNRPHLRELHDHGVFGFKCFLLPSGVDEFPPLDPDGLEASLTALAGFGGLMIVHAEDHATIEHAPDPTGPAYADFLASRPPDAENRAIADLIERAERTGARVHVLHLSSADALPTIRAAKDRGLDLSVETCPHYLTLHAEEVPAGGTAYKCCPPIRAQANADLLWDALRDGTIDYIASDHSPSTLDLKQLASGDFGTAWGGIASVQLALPAVWTEARRRGVPLEQVTDWMAARPATRVGLPAKGAIRVGAEADLVVFAPEQSFVVDQARLLHKNPLTPYHGKTLHGVVRRTLLHGTDAGDHPRGRILRPGSTPAP